MVGCGRVWYGVVWCGMVWYGGMVCYEQYGQIHRTTASPHHTTPHHTIPYHHTTPYHHTIPCIPYHTIPYIPYHTSVLWWNECEKSIPDKILLSGARASENVSGSNILSGIVFCTFISPNHAGMVWYVWYGMVGIAWYGMVWWCGMHTPRTTPHHTPHTTYITIYTTIVSFRQNLFWKLTV